MPDMYDETEQELTNQQKAAILFITLGPENSAKVFQHMADDEIEKIAVECTYDRTRKIGSFKTLDYDDIVAIYKACR